MVVVAPSSLSHSLSHVAAIGLGSALKTLRLTHLASLPHHRPSLLGSWFPTELDKMAALLTNTPMTSLSLHPAAGRFPLPSLFPPRRARESALQLLSRHRRPANHEAPSTPCESRSQRGSQIEAPNGMMQIMTLISSATQRKSEITILPQTQPVCYSIYARYSRNILTIPRSSSSPLPLDRNVFFFFNTSTTSLPNIVVSFDLSISVIHR